MRLGGRVRDWKHTLIGGSTGSTGYSRPSCPLAIRREVYGSLNVLVNRAGRVGGRLPNSAADGGWLLQKVVVQMIFWFVED